MTQLTMSTWEEGLQSAAVFMRSPGSSESRPPKARETKRTTKAAAAHTVSWATAGEAMDRGGAAGPQCPQTLGGRTPTNEHCGLVLGGPSHLRQ